MPGGHVSLFSSNGLHSSGGGSGRPEEPELPEDEDVFANGDSTQIPVRQQPIESQRTGPGIPLDSPHTRPSSQQPFGGDCPAGLVQRHASPAAGKGCASLAERPVPPPPSPSPSTVCEHATRNPTASEAESESRRRLGFMGVAALALTHGGVAASTDRCAGRLPYRCFARKRLAHDQLPAHRGPKAHGGGGRAVRARGAAA